MILQNSQANGLNPPIQNKTAVINAGNGNMCYDSPEAKECVQALKEVDFELAFLALLTCDGLKPLSRWEKSLNEAELGLLGKMGLLTKQIRRTEHPAQYV